MATPSVKGADSDWYKEYQTAPSPMQKYWEEFRDRSTLLAIPPANVEQVKKVNKQAYINAETMAQFRRSKVTKEGEGVRTFPPEAAIVIDNNEKS